MALERNGLVVARRLMDWNLKDLLFIHELPRDLKPNEWPEFLDNQVGLHRLDVVIVDHLQDLVKLESGNEYALVSDTLAVLNRIAKRHACHVILLHHQGKTETRDGTINALGSEAYRAAADVLLEVTQRNGEHFLRGHVRGEPDLDKLRVTVDLQTGLAKGVDAVMAKLDDATAAVINCLKQNQPNSLTANEIQQKVNLKRKLVFQTLNDAAEGRLVDCQGTGKKGDPKRYSYRAELFDQAALDKANIGQSPK